MKESFDMIISPIVQAVYGGDTGHAAVCGNRAADSARAAVTDGRTDKVGGVFPPFPR